MSSKMYRNQIYLQKNPMQYTQDQYLPQLSEELKYDEWI
jgi:hypothetical protein